MTRPALTATEARVLTIIRTFYAHQPPRAPVLREIAALMGWKSTSAAHEYVGRLVEAGYLARIETDRRGVRYVPVPSLEPDPRFPVTEPE